MNDEDYAIIVGIQTYPGIDDPDNGQPSLLGTENDARAFRDWVVSPDGGGVPNTSDHVTLILSSDYTPLSSQVIDGVPAANDVQKAFRKLQLISKKNASSTGFTRVGRRLYIFMAGHGIVPNQGGSKDLNDAALLMADYEPALGSATYIISGAYTANWFSLSDCFDEILLFMDCCRQDTFVVGSNEFLGRTSTADNARRYYAFATKWSRLSRERPMPDENGKVRGVFTKTLLLGLSGAAAEPNPDRTQGVITGRSLKNYLINNMEAGLEPELRNEYSAKWEPEITCRPDPERPGNDILIKTVPLQTIPLQTFPVVIHIPSGASGDLQLVDHQFTNLYKKPVGVTPVDLSFNLARGRYLASVTINGTARNKPFDVKGITELGKTEGVEVNF